MKQIIAMERKVSSYAMLALSSDSTPETTLPASSSSIREHSVEEGSEGVDYTVGYGGGKWR